MAYIVKYDDEYLFDPYTNDDTIYDAKISANVNAAVYFDFTIPPTHRLYDKIEEQAGIVRVYSDKKLLFLGEVTDIEDDFEGNKSISCSDPRMHLNDVLLRPYSTAKDEEPLLAPSSVEGYFQWLINQYNSGTLNPKFQFQVGVNQGAALTKNNYIYIKNENLPGIGSELENQILDSYGGYLIMTYPNGIPTFNLYADVHEANTQIIDFGVNLVDFKRSSSTDDQYTAIRPVGGTPERKDDDPEGYTPTPITIESLPDGTTQIDADYVKMKDVVYSVSRVNRYGYKEYNWTNSNILDQNVLLEEAISDLKKCVDPSKTLEVKAVDLALFMDDYDHLECGEVARIRSKPHNIDEYLLVNSMDINLQDPSQTTYTLGEAYDSLTGEQSSFVKSLNAGINSSLDKVAGLDQTVKDQAIKVDQAVTDASNAVDTANDANKVANDAQNAADNAQQSADKAQETADSAKQTADSANETANSAKEEVGKIQTDIGDINADLEKIKQDAQATSEKADAAATKADEAGAKADALQSTVSNVQTTINGVQSDVGELKTSVSGAVEKSNEALTAASSAQQNLDGFKMEVSQTYQVKGDYATNDSLNGAIAQEVLDRNSAISQSASEIKQTVSETYQVKGDYLTEGKAAETYATQSSVSQTANSIKSEVSKTYATIATVDGLKNIADNAIESWTGSTAPTTSNKPASDWTTAELKKQHSGDLYYDTSTGYSYRYGSNDGIDYSWTLVKDTDITKALANASAAKQAADTAQSGVNKINADLPVTYATKSDVTQTADSIKSEVSKTYSTKTETSAVETKADTAQSTADAAKSAASTAQSTANTAKQNAATAQTTADSAKTAASNAQSTANTANSTANTAKQNAATAQTTADNAQKNLDAYKQTVSTTYATKSDVTQTADSIKSEVSKTYTTKTEFNNLEIGGRNLTLGTSYKTLDNVTVRGNYGTISIDTSDTIGSRNTLNFVTTQIGSSGVRDIMFDLISELDKKNTMVSFWVKGSVSANMMVRIGGGRTAGSVSMNNAVSTSWNRIVLNLGVLGGSGSGASYVIIAFDRAGTFRVSGMKTEYGTKATDWSPAPEDMLSTADAETTYTTKTEFKQTADSINSTVSEVKQTADGALSKATTVEQTASGLTVRITQAEKDVDTAQATANTAKSTADSASKTASTASTNASTALNTANTAKSTADTANTNATEAKNSASTAVNTANTAKSTADSAKTTATSASTNATNALNRATYQYGTCATAAATAAKVVTLSGFSLFTGATIQVKFTYANTVANPTLNVNSTGAKTIHAYGASIPASSPYDWVAGAIVTFVYDGTYWNISDASSLSKANSAQSTANTANSTANTAKQNAATAQTTADAAKTAASNAQSTANTANSTANAAKTAAATAQSTANNAAKTATNYLKFDSNGLVVGDQTAGTLGKNVLIDADSVDIRTGSTILASFGSNSISLGKNSTASAIKMCNDAFEVLANIGNGNTNAIIGSNPSSGSGGNGSLELRSTNVGTARSSIKMEQSTITLSADTVDFLQNVKIQGSLFSEPTTIWSGTINHGGSATIPELPSYKVFIFCFGNDSAGRVFAYRYGDTINGLGGYGDINGAFRIQSVRSTASGTTLTIVDTGGISIWGPVNVAGNFSYDRNSPIKAIMGVM